MPFSSLQGKDLIKRWFAKREDIRSVVDFGAGCGIYAEMNSVAGLGLYLIAVEIWEPYIKEFSLHKLYDEIIVGNLLTVDLPKADCAILGDVLEHLSKGQALRAFRRIDKFYRHVIISIPWSGLGGEAVFGNPYELHKSMWNYEEVSDLVGTAYEVKKRYPHVGVFIK